ncbi:Glutathione S-transferase [Granulibacter bethesdensis]|uniref:glutathione transferase n=1 Tax=Granulibacter bethesdensis TaxID=364410 RepID=A0AAN0VFV4_9PROT|nr:glutathione S-transferase family protein [Granulibacter bethesdensis]AHJ63165.1 Glutathione S-transferase [Granulibacter bethesdensis]
MVAKIVLWGFDGSTYVRTVKMLFVERNVSDYEQVPVNVLKWEPRQPEHLERHPFGKVPVVDIDGFRVIETAAITRYLNAILPGPSLIPEDLKDRARMDMVINIIDSYGYNPLVGVSGYYFFPELIGGKNVEAHRQAIEKSHMVLSVLAGIKGSSSYLAGESVSLADLFLAPILAYIEKSPHRDEFLSSGPIGEWWRHISSRESFIATAS